MQKLGFVPIARTTFDIPLATDIATQVRNQLERAGFSIVAPDGLITTIEEAANATRQLKTTALDALLVLQTTFADSTMIQQLAEAIDAPLIMWAIPEAPNGERLRLNSLCGINLGGHALKRAGYHYDYIYAAPNDPAALSKVSAVTGAGYVRNRLKTARLGRIGEHPDGFDTCQFDPGALHDTFGVEIIQFDLNTLFERVRQADASAINTALDNLQLEQLDQMDQGALRSTLGTYVVLWQMAEEHNLDGFAVRCWPQFFTELGCAACGALSLMNNDLLPCSCETDINGAITQLILQWLSNAPVFGSDMVAFDEDTAVFWHCGKAPLSLANPNDKPRATLHTNRQKPLLMEFTLKPGRVTLARVSEATGAYRLVIGGGEMVEAPMSFTGTSGVVRFDRPAHDVLNTILGEGLEHHLALTYGDYLPALHALGQQLNIPILEL